jgi:NAD-dependent SIR2 family protein deacetylase
VVVSDRTQRNLRRAAALIAKADALLITAGAGMSVDSGLPDFRGGQGFWRAYPPLEKLRISFEEMAQPHSFAEKPEMAWAFYGHRQQLYRETKPHMGYWMLRDWARAMPAGHFVVTSNVDGAFEATGFAAERILEQHGNIHRYQCTVPCGSAIWTDDPPDLQIDLATLQARGQLPRCPQCGVLARPNVLMFGDFAWVADAMEEQRRRYQQWLASVRGKQLAILELGAGTALATIRWFGEKLTGERTRTTLVRINPDASDADEPAIPVRMTALEALTRIEEKLPESFESAAKAGVRIERPTAAVMPVSSRVGLESVSARDLEMLEFDVVPVSKPGRPAWWSSAASPIDLRSVTLLDLASGHVAPFNYLDISTAEQKACAARWNAAQHDFVPLPEVGGYVESGFVFRGGVMTSNDAPDGERPGAALIFICGPGEAPVLTVGIAHRASEGAFVWRYLYERADVHPKPLEHPRAPWVATRHEPAAEEHAAMLPVLGEVVRVLAWTWLRVQAYYEQQKREDEDE